MREPEDTDDSGRGIEWRDNYPYPVYKQPYTKESYSKLFPQAASARYLPKRRVNRFVRYRDEDGNHRQRPDPECENPGCTGCHLEEGEILPSEREFVSMTNAEAAVIRKWRDAANGDGQALEQLSDRIIGKPKQQIDQTTVTVDIHAVLGDILRAEQQMRVEDVSQPKAITDDTTSGAVIDISAVPEYNYLEDL